MSFVPVDQDVREQIANDLEGNLCVEAGAGTGKTTSLVSRITELLARGRATADDIAVITFTEKAAAELSTRVREELERAAREATDPTRRARLDQATQDLYRARIETIHSFASNLLRERPVEAGLDPGFTVMTDLEAQLFFDAAIDAGWTN
jgi:ATP-dependent helicase/nuclease subunit A